MENLFGTIGQSDVKDLLATGTARPVAISLKPGSVTLPAGVLVYRNSDGLYELAAAAKISASYNLLVLADDVDISTSAGIAVAAKAYESGCFKAGKVLKDDGNSGYEAVSAAEAIVLRQFGITFAPFDDWSESDVEIDNRIALTVTVTYGDNGTASADKGTAKKGEVVTLTATPASDSYVFDAWEVISGDITIGADNKFTMPDTAVSVKATFKSA